MSLTEIMLVIAIIALLATLAVPNFRTARRRAMNARFVNDLRILTDSVFEQYAIEKGDYPPDSAPGVMPPEVVAYMARRVDWEDGPTIGGQWDWDRAPARGAVVHGVYAALSIVNVSRTSAQMRELDGEFDDGSLLTGRFRQTVSGYMYILEE
jgi:hypothetical protein